MKHCGHIKREVGDLPISRNLLSEQQLEEMMKQCEAGLPPHLIRRIMDATHNTTLTNTQCSQLRQLFIFGKSDSTGNPDDWGPAERMLKILREDDEMEFLELYGERGQENLVTAYVRQSSASGVEPKQVTLERNKKKEMERLMKALKVQEGEKFLFGIAFTSKQAQRHHKKYSFLVGGDCTHGTNKERRPLFKLTGSNPNHR